MFEALTTDEMISAEKNTISNGTTGFQLMETAGISVAEQVIKNIEPCPVLVLCGPGNNGGDGFIVAQKLKDKGWQVRLACMEKRNKLKGDAAMAAQKWDGKIEELNSNLSVHNTGVVIDAIFGTGFNRELPPELITLFDKIRSKNIPVVAVDIPSGINATNATIAEGTLKTSLTVTFCRKKIGHLLLPAKNFCGKVIIADILITDECINQIETCCFENNPAIWLKDFPIPQSEQHKYSRGHTLVYGGEVRTGAACLAAAASQKIGSGAVTITSEPKVSNIYKLYRASIMVDEYADIEEFKSILRDERKNVALIGPGAGSDVKEYIDAIFSFNKSVVLDADVFSAYRNAPTELFDKLSTNCVLTPHTSEFEKLFPDMEGNKLEKTKQAAKISGAIIILKGADTIIAAPDGSAVINTNAPPSLATAGSGDVLAGMVAGLIAQGMNSFMAACAAVWLHGEAARLYGFGLTAEDIINELPNVLNNLFGINTANIDQ